MRTLDPIRLQTVVNERLTALLKKYADRVLREVSRPRGCPFQAAAISDGGARAPTS